MTTYDVYAEVTGWVKIGQVKAGDDYEQAKEEAKKALYDDKIEIKSLYEPSDAEDMLESTGEFDVDRA